MQHSVGLKPEELSSVCMLSVVSSLAAGFATLRLALISRHFRVAVMASCKCLCRYQVVEPVEEDGEEGEDAPDDPDAEHKMIQGVLESLLQDDEDADQPAQVSL